MVLLKYPAFWYLRLVNGQKTQTQAGDAGENAGTAGKETKEASNAGAEGSAGKVRSSGTRSREDEDNQSAAQTARQIIDEATAQNRDTGEAIKEACDRKVSRLHRLLGGRQSFHI